jgi:hypothetical protein
MSFNRTNYDKCKIDTTFRDSNFILMYQLEPSKYYNCNKCFMLGSIVGGPINSAPREQVVDTESQLFGIDRIYSKCPTHQFLPSSNTYNQHNGAPGDNQVQTNQLKTCFFVNQPKPSYSGINISYPTCEDLKKISQKNFKTN